MAKAVHVVRQAVSPSTEHPLMTEIESDDSDIPLSVLARFPCLTEIESEDSPIKRKRATRAPYRNEQWLTEMESDDFDASEDNNRRLSCLLTEIESEDEACADFTLHFSSDDSGNNLLVFIIQHSV